MPWIRLSDNYMDDEKIDALSDGAFRLWHAGMAYCRRNQTDGLIPFGIMRGLKCYTKGREKQLATACREGLDSLWKLVPGMGYIVANYLKYNLSKEEDQSDRTAATARMRKFRANQDVGDGVTRYSGDALVTPSHPKPCDAFVPGMVMDQDLILSSERESERKPTLPAVLSAEETRFDAFWASYPRKVGKDAARKAWAKRRPDSELLQSMLSALDWQKRSEAWLKEGGQFVPHPSTWLNEGRWQDEPQRAQSFGKQTSRLMAAVANIAREAQ